MHDNLPSENDSERDLIRRPRQPRSRRSLRRAAGHRNARFLNARASRWSTLRGKERRVRRTHGVTLGRGARALAATLERGSVRAQRATPAELLAWLVDLSPSGTASSSTSTPRSSQGETTSGTAIAEIEERLGVEWILAEVELAETMTMT